MTSSTPFSSPYYLWIDTRTDAFPNPTLGLKSRTRRKTTFRFQTEDCEFFVDVVVFYADSPDCDSHEVKITIDDYMNPGCITKIATILPNDGKAISVMEARAIADTFFTQYMDVN